MRLNDRMSTSRIGQYEITKEIGGGQQGKVYLAKDPVLNRFVAIKVPKIDGEAGQDIHQRFIVEAQAAAQIRHSNICTVFNFGEENGQPYFVMEFIDGPNLSELVSSEKFDFPARKIANVVRKLASGLAEAHRIGIVHRDIKPDNVRIRMTPGNSAKAEPVLVDFGLSRKTDQRLTETGALVGTVAYMAPEQVRGHEAKPASDIFSLGVVFYELMTRKHPFMKDVPPNHPDNGIFPVMDRIIYETPQAPSELNGEVTAEFERICMKMMQKELAGRYESMDDVADDLERALKDTPEAKPVESSIVNGIKRASQEPEPLVVPSPLLQNIKSHRAELARALRDDLKRKPPVSGPVEYAAMFLLFTLPLISALLYSLLMGKS